MAIDALGYGGFYSSYRVTDIPSVDIDTVKKQDEAKANAEAQGLVPVEESQSSQVNEAAPSEDHRSRSANLEDISLNFNTGDDYSYIGSDADLTGMDMQKAISDMRKDSILQDYQYFVGSAQDLQNTFANDDGKVFLKY